MTVAVNGILRVVPTFNLGPESKAQNVHHVMHTTGSVQAETDVVEACANWFDYIMASMIPQVHTSVNAFQVEVFEWVAGAWDPLGTYVPAFVGTNAGIRLPSGLACLLKLYKLRTGYADRRYFAGFTEGGVTNDTWDSAVLTTVSTAGGKFLVEYTDPNSVKLTPVYFNRSDGSTKTYVSYAPQVTVSYQRRRKPGVGLT